MAKLLLPAILLGYSNRQDKSVVLRFETQEQSPQQIAHIHGLMGTAGALYYKSEGELTQIEKEELDALDADLIDNPKKKSQRMRNVLYRIWEKEPKGFASFKDYYAYTMDKMIQQLKDKLQNLDT